MQHLFRRRLGEMLLEDGIISGEGLEQALKYAKEKMTPLGRTLLDLGLVEESTLAVYLERQLGESLVERNILNHDQLEDVYSRSQANNEPLGRILVRLGYVDDDELAQIMAEDYGFTCMRIGHLKIDRNVAAIMSRKAALGTMFLPVDMTEGVLTVATARPYDEVTVKALEEGTGLKITLFVVPEKELRAAIRLHLLE